MVHDHSGSMNRLVDLNYNSLEALKTACELVPKQKLIIERLPSVRFVVIPKKFLFVHKTLSYGAFSHVERLFDEASLKQREGDEEQSYQLLSRMGVISQLLISKNDFKQFKSTPDGRRFYDLFKTCISRMRELEESLEKRYELKEVEELYRKKEMHQNETTAAISKMVSATNGTTNQQPKLSEIQPESDIGFTITPRQLVRFAESNHQVLIIDYRSVQDSFIKYENVDRVLLAHVPSDAVVPGLLICLFLFSYNTTLRLRRAPVFLDGGFDNWKLHYPMFTSDRRSAKRIFCNINDQSEFAKAVAEFKKGWYEFVCDGCWEWLDKAFTLASEKSILMMVSYGSNVHLNIQSLQYPDLLHREKPPTAPTAAAAVPSTPAVPTRPEPPDSSSAAHQQMIYPSMNAEARPSEPAFRPSAAAPSAPSKNASGIATAPSVLLIRHPLTTYVQLFPTEALNRISRQDVRCKVCDKDVYFSDDVHRLLFLYDSMTKSIQSGAHSKRVNAGYTGLYNLGNTCFMNATLQALFNTRYLKNIFTRDKFAGFVNRFVILFCFFFDSFICFILIFRDGICELFLSMLEHSRSFQELSCFRGNKMGTSGVISAAFSALMDAVWSGAYSAIRPQQFLVGFVWELKIVSILVAVQRPVSFEQNYTGENLFEEAADYERRSKKFSSSPVNDIFGCQTVSELQCNTCGSQSVTFEEMTQLSIEIPSGRGTPTLMECINAHFEPVVCFSITGHFIFIVLSLILDRSCKWNCPTCKTLQVSTRRTRIWRLPKILVSVVHLKRFSFGANGWEKNDSLVHFNCLPLDVGDVVHKDIRKKYPSRSNCFSLYAVTRHSGRLNSGHYTSVVHNEQTKEWLYFDDECVTSINPDSICNKNAFILYFKSHNL
ncbi:unnamed protein product [Anisakis simplex]|uniref:Ubiquitin carboxyl-terminal hydrolase n=1 Tax=Anisakis simplex TaxID=6269 RepID=A0A0M3K0G0_ANISI|nr:unnamed protein product [Anisakis simplex]